jgi:hypothetical protein
MLFKLLIYEEMFSTLLNFILLIDVRTFAKHDAQRYVDCRSWELGYPKLLLIINIKVQNKV